MDGLNLEPAREAGIVEEISQHLDDRFAESRARGATEEEARRSALAELSGGEYLVRELQRVECPNRPEPVIFGESRGNVLENIYRDLRYAARMLCKSPGFTAVAVLTLAFGIGANTAIFSVVKTTLFDPLPVRHASDRYIQLVTWNRRLGLSEPGILPRELREVFQQTNLFSRVAAYDEWDELTLQGEEFPDPVHGVRVTPEFFRLWTLQPRLGRVFGDEEAQPGRDDVIVISHRFWQARLGGDPKVIGRVLRFQERPMTVVGVMPSFFAFPTASFEYWRPFTPSLQDDDGGLPRSGVLTELREGVEQSQAQAFLDVVSQRLGKNDEILKNSEMKCVDMRELFCEPNLRRTLWIMMGAVAFVLLIAAANIANLQLARTERRQQELAIRAALGASRMRVFRQLLTENLLLACVGGAAGLFVVLLGMDLLRMLIPPELPRLKAIGLDGGVLWIALAATLVTSVLFVMISACQGVRANLGEVLKLGAATSSRDRRGGRFSRGLIVGQITVALALLAGAGLMARSVAKLLAVDPGWDPRNVLLVYPGFGLQSFGDMDRREHASDNFNAVFADMQTRLAAIPGVRAAGVMGDGRQDFSASSIPGGRPVILQEFFVGTGRADPLRVMGVPLRQGRWLDLADARETGSRVLVNESAARILWPGENGTGKRLWLKERTGRTSFEHVPFDVVGVVADIRWLRYDETPRPAIFRVLDKTMPVVGPSRFLMVRTGTHPVSVYKTLGREIKAAGAGDRPPFIINMQETLYNATAGHRTLMLYLLVFSSVGVFLAALGLHGVLAYSVARRTREIGIRMALGAQRGDVLGLVMHEGLRLLGIGLVLGTITALSLGRVLGAFLFGLTTDDPLTLVSVALLLSLVALQACYLPARRAAKIDPMEALRCE